MLNPILAWDRDCCEHRAKAAKIACDKQSKIRFYNAEDSENVFFFYRKYKRWLENGL
jgi:hypothetical protein